MPRWQSTENTEQRIRSIAIQTSFFHTDTSRRRIKFWCPVAMMRSSRKMAARYSRSGSRRQRLMASCRLFRLRCVARTTDPLTPVPISLNPWYNVRGSVDATANFGNAFRILASKSFLRTTGSRVGMVAWALGGYHGRYNSQMRETNKTL